MACKDDQAKTKGDLLLSLTLAFICVSLTACTRNSDLQGRWVQFWEGYVNLDSIRPNAEPQTLDVVRIYQTPLKPDDRLVISRQRIALWCRTRDIALLSIMRAKEGETLRPETPVPAAAQRHPISDHTEPRGRMGGGINIWSGLADIVCNGSGRREILNDPLTDFRSKVGR